MTIPESVKWYIYSFMNEPSDYKIIFNNIILKQLKQYFLKKNINKQLSLGARLVCLNDDFPCFNCYVYGKQDGTGICLNHYGEEPSIWMDYKFFQEHIKIIEYQNLSWEEFNIFLTNSF